MYAYIVTCVFHFVADVVIVLDNERLLIQLQQDLPSEAHILPLPKSAGVSCINRTESRKGDINFSIVEGLLSTID